MRDFKAEISPCRTFCFLHELEMLLDHNLVKGGPTSTTPLSSWINLSHPKRDGTVGKGIQTGQDQKSKVKGYLNNLELRFPNEPARHKLLDVIGDLALIGYPIKGHSHCQSIPATPRYVDFAKRIKQYIKKNKHLKNTPHIRPEPGPESLTPRRSEKTLPHRFPLSSRRQRSSSSQTGIL